MRKKLLLMMLTGIIVLCGCGADTEIESIQEVSENTMVAKGKREITPSEAVQKQAEDKVEESVTPMESESEQEIEQAVESTPVQTMGEPQSVNDELSHETISEATFSSVPEITSATVPETVPAPHTCTWDGSTVTTNPTCTSEGIRTFQCTGCETTRTESVAKTAHNYVTESTPATCTATGTTKTYCNICGDIQSESAGEAAKGHIPGEKKYAYEGPTCTGGAYYNINCAVCGEVIETGTDPALPHTEVATVTHQGNCVEDTVISIDCSVCGTHIRKEFQAEDNHDWVTGEADNFNMDTLEWEKVPVIYCTRCHRQQ